MRFVIIVIFALKQATHNLSPFSKNRQTIILKIRSESVILYCFRQALGARGVLGRDAVASIKDLQFMKLKTDFAQTEHVLVQIFRQGDVG